MANVNDIITMMRHIEFYNTVAAFVAGYQGIDYVDKLQFLDDDRVINIYRFVCFPGGTGANNNPTLAKMFCSSPRKA